MLGNFSSKFRVHSVGAMIWGLLKESRDLMGGVTSAVFGISYHVSADIFAFADS